MRVVRRTGLGVFLAILNVLGRLEGRIFEPCELARLLVQNHKFPQVDIGNWICLLQWESNFDTAAVGRLNSDGSLDHGLFQINDKYWCGIGSMDGACGINCSDLEDENIRDDAICARRIFRVTKFKTGNGFSAWVAWTRNCQHKDVSSYVSNCTVGTLSYSNVTSP